MVASEIQRQLAKHRTVTKLSQQVVSRKKREVPSILYDSKEASLFANDELRRRAVESFGIILTTMDPNLASMAELFRPTRKSAPFFCKKRGFMTPSEAHQIDQILEKFIYSVGSYWQDEQVLNCLEHLIRQFEIQKYNIGPLLAVALPFHDTPLFGRLVHIIDLQADSQFLFLEAAKVASAPVKRSVIVQNCIRQPNLLSFFATSLVRVYTEVEKPNLPLTTFFVMLVIEVLGSPELKPSESFLRQLIPCLFFSLHNPSLRLSQELHIGSLCILSQLAQRLPLSRQTSEAVITDLFLAILKGLNSLTRKHVSLSEAFLFCNMLVTGQNNFQQEDEGSSDLFPQSVLSLFIKGTHQEDVISSIYGNLQAVDMTPVIGSLFRSIFNCMVITETEKLQKDLSSFALAFIKKGIEDQTKVLSSRTRTAIALASFDIICSTHTTKVPGLLAPILHMLEDHYPTTISTALRHVVEIPRVSKSEISRVIDVLSTTLNDSVTAPMSKKDILVGDVPGTFSLWTAMADPNETVRKEAVAVALDRAERFFNAANMIEGTSTELPPGARLLCDILLDKSTDRHFPIAKLVLSSKVLWRRTPTCIALASLFQQFYMIASKAASGAPWDTHVEMNQQTSNQTITECFLALFSANSDLALRFQCVLQAFGHVLAACPNIKVVEEAINCLMPILLPLASSFPAEIVKEDSHSISDSLQGSVQHFFDTVNNTISAFETPAAKQSDTQTNCIRLTTSKSALCDQLCKSQLQTNLNDVDFFGIRPVISVSMSHERVACPIVEPARGLLGGIWLFFARLEAFTYRLEQQTNKSLDDDTLIKIRSMCDSSAHLWAKANEGNAPRTTGWKACQQVFEKFLLTCLNISKGTDCWPRCMYLALSNVVDIETLTSLVTVKRLFPLVLSVLAKSPKVSDFLPTSLLSQARCHAAQILQGVLPSPSFNLAIGAVFIGLCDSHEGIRRHCVETVKCMHKVLKSETSSKASLDKLGIECILQMPKAESLKCVEEIMLSTDIRPLVKSVKRKGQEIFLGEASAIEALRGICCDYSEFIACISIVYGAQHPEGASVLIDLLKSSPFASLKNRICIPLWSECLLSSASSQLSEGEQCVVAFLTDLLRSSDGEYEFGKELWNKVLKLFCRLHADTAPNHVAHGLFLQLVSAFIQSTAFDGVPDQSQLLRLLLTTATKWEEGHICVGASPSVSEGSNNGENEYRSLCQVLRVNVAKYFEPKFLVNSIAASDDKVLDLRSFRFLIECATNSLHVNQSKWSPNLVMKLAENLAAKFSHYIENSANDLILGISISRCLTRSIGVDNLESISCKIKSSVYSFIQQVTKCLLTKRRETSKIEDVELYSNDIVTSLLSLITEFSVRLGNQKFELIEELLQLFVKDVLNIVLEKNCRLLEHGSVVTSLKASIPKLLEQSSDNISKQTRAMNIINPIFIAVIPKIVQSCFSKATPVCALNDQRCQTESNRMQQLILTLASAFDYDQRIVASMLFATICLWNRELDVLGQQAKAHMLKGSSEVEALASGSEEGALASGSVCDDRWMTSMIAALLENMENGMNVMSELARVGMCHILLTTKSQIDKFEFKLFKESKKLFCGMILPDDLKSEITKKKTHHLPKSLFICFASIKRYLSSVGSPTLDCISVVGKDDEKLADEDIGHSDVIIKEKSLQIKVVDDVIVVAALIEVLLIGECVLEGENSSRLIPVKLLIKKLKSEIIENLSLMLGTYQLVYLSYQNGMDLVLLSHLFESISTSHFSGHWSRNILKTETMITDKKKRKRKEIQHEMNDEPYSPLNLSEIEKARQIQPLIKIVLTQLTGGVAITNIEHCSELKKNQNFIVNSLSFLADLMLMTGACASEIFADVWIKHLPSYFASCLFMYEQHDSVDASYLFSLCRNVHVMCLALPSHAFLPTLNDLLTSMHTLVDKLVSPLSENDELNEEKVDNLKILLCAFTSLFAFSTRNFMGPHISNTLEFVLGNPYIIIKEIWPQNAKLFISGYEALQSLGMSLPDTSIEQIQQMSNQSWTTKSQILINMPFTQLWKQLFDILPKSISFRIIMKALVKPAKKYAADIATNESQTSLAAVRLGAILTLLSKALQQTTPEHAALHHKDISAIVLATIHAASLYAERVGAIGDKKVLSISVQGGAIEGLFYNKDERSLLSHPSSIIDISQNGVWYNKDLGILECGLCIVVQAWLPKMTNSHLQPFLKTLLKYCRRENEVLVGSEESHLMDREVACARLYLMILSVVCKEIGELGITGILAECLPDIRHCLMASTKNGFELSMSGKERKMEKKQSKKKRNALTDRLSIQDSWYWLDLGLPSLYTISSICSTKISNVAAISEILLTAIIDSLDLFAVLDRPVDLRESNEQEFDRIRGNTGNIWLSACRAALLELIESLLGDQVQLQIAIQKLLEKIQSTKNSSVRLGGVLVLSKLWESHQAGLLPTLSDSLQAFVELLENYDEDVERSTRHLIELIETLTGESLQSRLRAQV